MYNLYDGKFIYGVNQSENILWWQVNGKITLPEVTEIIDKLKKEVQHLKSGSIKLIVDNSKMLIKGSPILFTPDVNEEWEGFQGWLIPHCQNTVVVCNGTTMKLQMDRLSRNSGLSLKSFLNLENRESALGDAIEFIGVSPSLLKELLNTTGQKTTRF